ncbi:hypothetical protein BD311DRAFT_772708 [Dichomitus squalens]|uniref:Uncharacterized protein n=1 Tax=Dichomitus squalens TaxID=114155 RepID=A0A4Q9N8M1_9APHY|nr:hypothetical protein BD311DRAFT_772708 [Dichomitus squalens]
MVEMLAMLQEMQKRKATKSSARSIAFQKERDALYTTARKKAEASLRDGMASLDKARALVSDLRAKEVTQEATLNQFRVILAEQNACVQTLLGHHTEVIEDLSHLRAAQINEASAMCVTLTAVVL